MLDLARLVSRWIYAWINPRIPPPPLPLREGERFETSNLVILREKPRLRIICWEEAASYSVVRALDEMEALLRKRFPKQGMHSHRSVVSRLVTGLMEVVSKVLSLTAETQEGTKVRGAAYSNVLLCPSRGATRTPLSFRKAASWRKSSRAGLRLRWRIGG